MRRLQSTKGFRRQRTLQLPSPAVGISDISRETESTRQEETVSRQAEPRPALYTPPLLTDGGAEKYNSAVDNLVDSGLLKQILDPTEIRYSNFLIESWWRVLKHQSLFLNTVASVRMLIAFYVGPHDTRLPHSDFEGQTPAEMYFGTGDDIPNKLEAAKLQARELRLKTARERNCHVCSLPTSAGC